MLYLLVTLFTPAKSLTIIIILSDINLAKPKLYTRACMVHSINKKATIWVAGFIGPRLGQLAIDWSGNEKTRRSGFLKILAETVGFEPTIQV